MDTTQKYTLNPDFTVEKFDNEILLYSISKSKGIYLNETACLIWEICGKGHSVEETIELLKEAFPGNEKSIEEDVLAVVESLLEKGALIHVAN